MSESTLLDLYETYSHNQKLNIHYLRRYSHETRTEAEETHDDEESKPFESKTFYTLQILDFSYSLYKFKINVVDR